MVRRARDRASGAPRQGHAREDRRHDEQTAAHTRILLFPAQLVTPLATGRATLAVERYDPIEGWLYFTTYHVRVSGTAATVAFRPPFVGRWRVSGSYDGTRTSSPSSGGTARFDVLEPLE